MSTSPRPSDAPGPADALPGGALVLIALDTALLVLVFGG